MLERMKPGRLAIAALLALLPLAAAACGDRGKDGVKSEARSPRGGEPTPTGAATRPETQPAAVLPREEPRDSGAGLVKREVTYEEAEAAFREGRYDEAANLFSAYTTRRPKNPWGHYMLGLSAWKSGRNDKAQEAFRQALELDPGHGKSLLNLSRVLLDAERPREALEHVEKVLRLDPESNAAYRLLGRARYELGDHEKAVEAYHKALTLDDQDAWSMNNLGLILIRRGRFEEALPPLARATQLRSDVAVFQNNLGVALERTGHFVAAAAAYKAALSADTAYEKASISLARVSDRKEDAGVRQVDLATLAQAFVEEIAKSRQPVVSGASPGESDTSGVSAVKTSVKEVGDETSNDRN